MRLVEYKWWCWFDLWIDINLGLVGVSMMVIGVVVVRCFIWLIRWFVKVRFEIEIVLVFVGIYGEFDVVVLDDNGVSICGCVCCVYIDNC